MSEVVLSIEVDSPDTKRAGAEIKEIARELSGLGAGIQASVQKREKETLDLGTILVAVMGTKAVFELAKALTEWVRKHNTKIRVKKADGTEIVIENVAGDDVAKIASGLGWLGGGKTSART